VYRHFSHWEWGDLGGADHLYGCIQSDTKDTGERIFSYDVGVWLEGLCPRMAEELKRKICPAGCGVDTG